MGSIMLTVIIITLITYHIHFLRHYLFSINQVEVEIRLGLEVEAGVEVVVTVRVELNGCITMIFWVIVDVCVAPHAVLCPAMLVLYYRRHRHMRRHLDRRVHRQVCRWVGR